MSQTCPTYSISLPQHWQPCLLSNFSICPRIIDMSQTCPTYRISLPQHWQPCLLFNFSICPKIIDMSQTCHTHRVQLSIQLPISIVWGRPFRKLHILKRQCYEMFTLHFPLDFRPFNPAPCPQAKWKQFKKLFRMHEYFFRVRTLKFPKKY